MLLLLKTSLLKLNEKGVYFCLNIAVSDICKTLRASFTNLKKNHNLLLAAEHNSRAAKVM